MGVQVSVTLYAPSQDIAESAASAAFKRFAELEDIMSDYRPTSELMRLCARSGGPPVRVSGDLFRVLKFAKEISRRSNGAFDVTVGPMVQLWRQSRKNATLPSEDELKNARALVGWRKVLLNDKDRTVRLTVPGMRLDLGGIAKGYAGDEAIKSLKRSGIRRAMVEAGGDIVLSGPPPGERGWRIAIPAARSEQQGTTGNTENTGRTTLPLSNRGISTSGDTYQFVEIGGKRYSHVVDPRTGLGLTSHILVTVIARNGLTSDPLSKVLSVLGKDRGLRVARAYLGVKAYIQQP